MKLRYLGFCGIDDSIMVEDLVDISIRHPYVEWGALIHPDKEGLPRYPSRSRLEQLRGKGLHLAAHLCGNACDAVLNGDYTTVEWLSKIGFKRFQLNPTRANDVIIDKSRLTEYIASLRGLMTAFDSIEFIVQANGETSPIWHELVTSPPDNMSLLFDSSCGRGVPITADAVHKPFARIRCGYAGGLGPSTLLTILDLLADVVGGQHIWVDMESSLRSIDNDSGRDVFSLETCRSCLDIVRTTDYLVNTIQ